MDNTIIPPGFTNDFNYYYYYSNKKVSLLTSFLTSSSSSYTVMSMFIIAVTNGALLSGSRHLPTIYPVFSLKCASLPGLRPSSTPPPPPPASIINLRHCSDVLFECYALLHYCTVPLFHSFLVALFVLLYPIQPP